MIITIDYVAVLMAAVVSFAFGALWHSNLGLGGTWRSLMGFSDEDMRSMPLSPMQAMLIGFIVTVLFAYVLAHFIGIGGLVLGGVSVGSALETGFWVWLGFVVVTLANAWLWEGKSLNLFLFNAAYQFLSIELMSAIIGFWHQ